jgi:hypothetical protein
MQFARRSTLHSPYLEAVKYVHDARFDLSSSGVEKVQLNELGVRMEELELSGSSAYGDVELIELIAARAGVPAECVVLTLGTSLANNVAMAALFDPGDEVLIEEPTYDPVLYTARLLGAEIRRLPRREENGFAVDPDELRRLLTTRTRMVALCNLHNPTSARIGSEEMRALGEIAAKVGVWVLVDEVYRETVWGEERKHALSLGENFVVTSSLTKAFGLSGLRCGWILAQPELAGRMRRMQELYHGVHVRMAERLSVAAMRSLAGLEARARLRLDANRACATELLASHPAVRVIVPEFGTTVAPRLLRGSADEFCQLLRNRYEVAVASGSHFEMPGHIRIGLGGDPKIFREGLGRVMEALDEFGRC